MEAHVKNKVLIAALINFAPSLHQNVSAASQFFREAAGNSEGAASVQSQMELLILADSAIAPGADTSNADPQKALVRCCYLNCWSGQSYCTSVPEGQCVQHSCH
jgi:hypothetical protein